MLLCQNNTYWLYGLNTRAFTMCFLGRKLYKVPDKYKFFRNKTYHEYLLSHSIVHSIFAMVHCRHISFWLVSSPYYLFLLFCSSPLLIFRSPVHELNIIGNPATEFPGRLSSQWTWMLFEIRWCFFLFFILPLQHAAHMKVREQRKLSTNLFSYSVMAVLGWCSPFCIVYPPSSMNETYM